MNPYNFNDSATDDPFPHAYDCEPIAQLLAVLACARQELERRGSILPRDERSSLRSLARGLGCSFFTAMVLDALRPWNGPEYSILYHEGPILNPVGIEVLYRDIDLAYTTLVTPKGELIEHGLMQPQDPVDRAPEWEPWHYVPRAPDDPRLHDAVAFTVVIGTPHANA